MRSAERRKVNVLEMTVILAGTRITVTSWGTPFYTQRVKEGPRR